MNILFIYSLDDVKSQTKPLRSPEQNYLGISYISSFLKKHGHQTKLIILSKIFREENERLLDECLDWFRPELICFTSISTEYPFISRIAKHIKDRLPNIYLLIGGPHVSLNPGGILDNFDALCIGEGEKPVFELVSQLERNVLPSGVENLWVKHGNEIEKNQTRAILEDLDSLPFPDRDMWREWIDEEPGARYSILMSRGCPFQCTYCSNHALKKIAPGKYVRFRQPSGIIEEIKDLIKHYPEKRYIRLESETVGVNKKWLMELCSELESFNSTLSDPLSFEVNLRVTPNMDFENIFTMFQRSNCKRVNIGIEAGSERVRREVLKRNYSNEDIIQAAREARKHGLEVFFFNMIGLPGETLDDFQETVNINRICQPDGYALNIFYPYPGTNLYFLCEDQGLLKTAYNKEAERTQAVLDLPGFSRRQINKSYIWFDYHVYKGHKPMYKILLKVLASKMKMNAWTAYLYRSLTRYEFFKNIRYLLISR